LSSGDTACDIGAYDTATAPSPTLSHVARTGVSRHGTNLTLRWNVISRAGIAGFSVYAGTHRLNKGIIPLHASPQYRYSVRWDGAGPYTLHILLHHGEQIVALGG